MAEHAAAPDEVVDTPAEPDEDPDHEHGDEHGEADEPRKVAPAASTAVSRRSAGIVGLMIVAALAVSVGWLGYRTYELHQADRLHERFVEVARQGALNLTTIDWQRADADVQRILESATGAFLEDFQRRSGPFLDVVQQAQSTSVGTVTEAALESSSGDDAKVLVAVSVNTSTGAVPEQSPRAWRMRITVQRLGDEIKVANVEFVP
ncbi:hypothetical protein AU195_08460 [Mycobacterium sp. IS-1496]|uniref:hypothetical protein n=1 Tax=Mycobacterium sp. IS-1496 TaxID=1772284 RepID=UPI0007416512|nr:hypothetical protein [Mycobacterium sp. IS-1496]KUI31776.1 hypothetical protein AU195_08460 [Mycobacterium sp. IS-1496]